MQNQPYELISFGFGTNGLLRVQTKNDFTLGLSGSLSKRLIQKLKWPIIIFYFIIIIGHFVDDFTGQMNQSTVSQAVKDNDQSTANPTCYSASYMSQTTSALRSWKLRLIGRSSHPLPALMDNWTRRAASRHTITPVSYTRPSPGWQPTLSKLLIIVCPYEGRRLSWPELTVGQQLDQGCLQRTGEHRTSNLCVMSLTFAFWANVTCLWLISSFFYITFYITYSTGRLTDPSDVHSQHRQTSNLLHLKAQHQKREASCSASFPTTCYLGSKVLPSNCAPGSAPAPSEQLPDHCR